MRLHMICKLLLIVSTSFALVSCKPKQGSKVDNSGENSSGTVNADGTPADVSNGDETNTLPADTAQLALQTRASEIHDSIIAKLEQLNGDAKNKQWSSGVGDLAQDWLISTPLPFYFGKTLDQVPINSACDAKDPSCDPQFLRKLCSSDADCSAIRTSCQPLSASVAKEGEAPRTMCLMPADKIMDRMYNILISAEETIDMTSLSTPDGRFRQVLINAIAYVTHKPKVPSIRMLFSGDNANFVNIVPPKIVLDKLMDEVEKRGGVKSKPEVNLAFLSSGKASWNHTKIIIVDQKRMLQGGHNFWDGDYLGDFPVFDVSLELSGPAVVGAQGYINSLWDEAFKSRIGIDLGYTIDMSTHPGSFNRLPQPTLSTSVQGGHAKVINMGRMGAFGDNAADNGIIGLIEAAKSKLYLSQQDLFNGLPIAPVPSWALGSLVDALLRGVHIKIVQSTPSGNPVGYGLVSAEVSMREIFKAAEAEAKKRNFVPDPGKTVRETFCQRFEITTFGYTDGVKKWSDGTNINNHAKMLISDEVSFYIGSQNFYPANLQEFGTVVSDAGHTQYLLENYWNPLWNANEKSKIPCK